MVHVVGSAGYSRVIYPALPDQLEEIVHTGQDVVHEDDRIEVLVLRVAQLVQRHERGVAHFGEVLDTVVERPACTLRCPDGNAHAYTSAERIEDAEKSLRLVRRSVLVDRDVHVVVPEDGRHSEKGSEKVRDDVE